METLSPSLSLCMSVGEGGQHTKSANCVGICHTMSIFENKLILFYELKEESLKLWLIENILIYNGNHSDYILICFAICRKNPKNGEKRRGIFISRSPKLKLDWRKHLRNYVCGVHDIGVRNLGNWKTWKEQSRIL